MSQCTLTARICQTTVMWAVFCGVLSAQTWDGVTVQYSRPGPGGTTVQYGPVPWGGLAALEWKTGDYSYSTQLVDGQPVGWQQLPTAPWVIACTVGEETPAECLDPAYPTNMPGYYPAPDRTTYDAQTDELVWGFTMQDSSKSIRTTRMLAGTFAFSGLPQPIKEIELKRSDVAKQLEMYAAVENVTADSFSYGGAQTGFGERDYLYQFNIQLEPEPEPEPEPQPWTVVGPAVRYLANDTWNPDREAFAESPWQDGVVAIEWRNGPYYGSVAPGFSPPVWQAYFLPWEQDCLLTIPVPNPFYCENFPYNHPDYVPQPDHIGYDPVQDTLLIGFEIKGDTVTWIHTTSPFTGSLYSGGTLEFHDMKGDITGAEWTRDGSPANKPVTFDADSVSFSGISGTPPYTLALEFAGGDPDPDPDPTCLPTDTDCDGDVDIADLLAVLGDWTGAAGAGPGPDWIPSGWTGAQSPQVPEPTGGLLGLAAVVALLGWRRRSCQLS